MWSQVLAAGRLEAPDSSKALESLCRVYWYPIYAFLRRWGHDHQAASDLTQGFFAYLLAQNLVRKADPDKGRFRSFLLGTLRNFVSNQQAKEHARKRGGGSPHLLDRRARGGRPVCQRTRGGPDSGEIV